MKIPFGILEKSEEVPSGGHFKQGEFSFLGETETDPVRRRHRRLFRYLFAGGMRQTRRTTVDDIMAYRNRRFVVVLAVLSVVWCIFYFFVPCN